jgi:hypothetical protein
MTSTASCVADARPARRVLLSKSDWLRRGDLPVRRRLVPGLAVLSSALFLVFHYEPGSSSWKLGGERDNK